MESIRSQLSNAVSNVFLRLVDAEKSSAKRNQIIEVVLSFWRNIYTGGKAGGPLRGPRSLIILYSKSFEIDSKVPWLKNLSQPPGPEGRADAVCM